MRGIKVGFIGTAMPLFIVLALFSLNANAAIDNVDLLDSVLQRYQAVVSGWGTVITTHASWLFWLLATISLVITFGFLALKKADISDFFAEFVRFTLVTGFFWWLLINGPAMGVAIINSLRQIGASASGNPVALSPSGIVDIGFMIFGKVYDQSSAWSPVDSAAGILISGIILVFLALVAVNMLILLISGWLLAYAGIFILGFGGSKWTSEMAISYYKSVLGIALQLMTMVLLVGIGKSFVDQYYSNMSNGIVMKELGVMLIVAIVLHALVKSVPPLIGALAGGQIQALGNGFGVGSALAAASIGGAALATAGAALAAGATSAAGGASALFEAFKAAQAAEGAGGGGDQTSLMSAVGSGQSSGADGGSSGSASGSNQNSAPLAAAMGEPPAGVTPISSSGGSSGGTAGKAARVAAGTVSNLARGGFDVAANKISSVKDSALQAISQTTGGQIATAIRDRAADTSNNFISAGNENATEVNAEEEKASFVNAGHSANERTA